MSRAWLAGVMSEAEAAPGPSGYGASNYHLTEEEEEEEVAQVSAWLSRKLSSPSSPALFNYPRLDEIDSTSPSSSPGASNPVIELSSSSSSSSSSRPSTSTGSISIPRRNKAPAVDIPHPPAVETPEPPPGVEIPQPPPDVEISTSPVSTSPVFGRNKRNRKRAPKQVHYVEVTVVDPPLVHTANEFARMLARIEWRKKVADLLPGDLLVAAPPRRGRLGGLSEQIYNPCSSWEEFIQRTHEEESRKAGLRTEKRSRISEALEGPADPIGSSRNAIVEIYSERLDAAQFAKMIAALRIMEVRSAYANQDFEWDNLQDLSAKKLEEANTSLMRKFLTETSNME